MDNTTFAVCNHATKIFKIRFPLEKSLKTLSKNPGTYVCGIFDCCREQLPKAMRGEFIQPPDEYFESNDYINYIFWFGCAPNSGVDANSTIAIDFFKELRRVANPADGTVILPHDMLTWHPGNGGNMLHQFKYPLVITFDDWIPIVPTTLPSARDEEIAAL